MAMTALHKQIDEFGDWRSALKQWRIGALVALLCVTAAGVVIMQLTPYYKASVQLLVPLKLVEDPGDRKGTSPQQVDILVVKSFTDLIQDDGLSRKVIRDLDLVRSADFQPTHDVLTDIVDKISRLITPKDDGVSPFSAQELTNDRILQAYEGRLKAASESKDLTITLSFEARDPHLAEQIVMAHAHAFVQAEIDYRRADFDSKVRWMKAELDRTAAEARDAQVAIQLNPTALTFSKSSSASAVSDLKMRQLEATGTQAVYDSVLKRYQDMVADQTYGGSDIRIVSGATLPTHPSFPKKLISISVATLISLVFGVFAAGIASVVRRQVSVDNFAKTLELPVLARLNIPHAFWSNYGLKRRVKWIHFWQRVHNVRRMIHVTGRRHPITLVTSLLPGEGKSLVASALARSLASSGLRTLLVDLNGRNTRYQISLDGRSHSPLGLQDYLEGVATAKEVAVQVDSGSPLFLMTNRDATDISTLSGGKLRSRFVALKKDFDAIVVDGSALTALSDTLQIAGLIDEIVIAVLAKNQQLEKLEEDVSKIRARSGMIKGIIIIDKAGPDTDDLVRIEAYRLTEPLRDVWPKSRATSFFKRGRGLVVGQSTSLKKQAEA